MNALNMRLESKSYSVGTQKKCMEGSGKKSKSNRKKINSSIDKELQGENGLGCESLSSVDLNKKPVTTADFVGGERKRGKNISDENTMIARTEKIQEQLQNSLTEETKQKISSVLNEVKLLSDVEKLLLYLQLPTGSSTCEDPLKQKGQNNPLGKKSDEEGTLAVTWVQSHLEEDPEVSLPKQEVYDEYQSYCELTGNEPLCAADFGKVMKQIFPSVKPRRLGTRGNSRYCYSGLRKKVKVGPPFLPDFQAENNNPNRTDEVLSAACHVLFEWAEKLLGVKFTSLKDLASHLIENMFVDNRSVAAYTLLLSSSQNVQKAPPITEEKEDNKSKKSEAQLHLQRKIQEKELIKGQKQILEEHRSHLTSSREKLLPSRRKGFRNRKVYQNNPRSGQVSKKNAAESACQSKTHTENLELPIANDIRKCSSDTKSSTTSSPVDMCSQSDITFQPSDSVSTEDTDCVNSSNKPSVDSIKVKEKNKPSLSMDNPVCISQSLSGFIIVPSLQQVQLSDVASKTKSTTKTPSKYKRIQPKPLMDVSTSSAMRCRTGSFGSALLKESKANCDGRRSSLALLQTDNVQDNTEENRSYIRSKSFKYSLSNSKHTKALSLKSFKNKALFAEDTVSKSSALKLDQYDDSIHVISQDQKSVKRLGCFAVQNAICEQNTDLSTHKADILADDVIATKRHSEELDFQTVPKKPHLDELGSSDISSESLSPWAKDVPSISSRFSQNCNDNGLNKHEEVSIRELESDALIDYLHGANIDTTHSEVMLQGPHENSLNMMHNDGLCIQNSKSVSNPEVHQLSQLRLLLEQNLPHPMAKSPRNLTESNNASKKHPVLMHTKEMTSAQIDTLCSSKTSLSNSNEISSIFLKNNSYLNHDLTLNGILHNNQITSENSPNDLASAGMSEQDLLNIMRDSSFTKNHSLIVNSNSTNAESNFVSQLPIAASVHQHYAVVGVEHNSTQTQVPSVPPSPNTRRRAFNFMPISPRDTPISEITSNTQACFSPVSTQQSQNTVSVAVGTSQPPSNNVSPFVSPRSTPIPPSRSRHSSGQSTYSTSRHTPFQNFDSGVSSISSSPFISPQPTPVPVSRLRHNSSHGLGKTVTFSTINNNQIVHTLSSTGHVPLRLRHSSGSTGSHLGFTVLSPRSAPLSPLVNENSFTHFNFPTGNESRSRHGSGLTATPLSPVSEQILPSNNINQQIDISYENITATDPFVNLNSGKEIVGVNPIYKQTRQRHASSSVIYNKSPGLIDPLAQEVQLLFKNGEHLISNTGICNRSRSVPLHQMLQNLASNAINFQPPDEQKLYSTSKQNIHFSILPTNATDACLPMTSDSLVMNCDKSLQPTTQNVWANLDGSNVTEMSSTRRNIAGLLEGDDLQATLEDLRDCDTDFSQFAQELEMIQNDDGRL